MTTTTSRDVQLAKRPVGMPNDDDFQVVRKRGAGTCCRTDSGTQSVHER